MKLSFEAYPNVLDRIQVWTIRCMIINGNFVEVKKFGDNFGLMDWGIVVLKSSTTNCILMCWITSKTRSSSSRREIGALTDLTTKGTKVPFCLPPYHYSNSISFFAIQSFSHFSSGVLNTQVCREFNDFSIKHSSLQIVPWNCSADQSFLSRAQWSPFAASSGVSFGRFFAIHFHSPLLYKYWSGVLMQAWG